MSAIIDPIVSGQGALPVCLCPWLENPYGLVSLLDMEQITENKLHQVTHQLDRIHCHWEHIATKTSKALSEEAIGFTKGVLGQVQQSIRNVDYQPQQRRCRNSGEFMADPFLKTIDSKQKT